MLEAWWFEHVRLINAWGPSEACCFAPFNEYKPLQDSPVNIGHSAGARSWIVEPDNHNRLAPIGTMNFVTRKDTQIKVRGFRIETEEIESQIQDAVRSIQQVAVDVLRTDGGRGIVSRLVAYICFSSTTQESGTDSAEYSNMFLPMDDSITQTAAALKGLLEVKLPSYMVPVAYLPLRYVPLSTSQKIDRKVLRCAAEKIPDADFSSFVLASATKEPLATEAERQMQALWADVLGIPPAATTASFSLAGTPLQQFDLSQRAVKGVWNLGSQVSSTILV